MQETKAERKQRINLSLQNLLPIESEASVSLIAPDNNEFFNHIINICNKLGKLPQQTAKDLFSQEFNRNLLIRAFSHWSAVPKTMLYNNLFEIVGNSNIELFFVEYLTIHFPKEALGPKGDQFCTEVIRYLIQTEVIGKCFQKIGLDKFIRYRPYEYTHKNKIYKIEIDNGMREDFMESFLGAIETIVDGCISPGLGQAVTYNILASYFDTIEIETDMHKISDPVSYFTDFATQIGLSYDIRSSKVGTDYVVSLYSKSDPKSLQVTANCNLCCSFISPVVSKESDGKKIVTNQAIQELEKCGYKKKETKSVKGFKTIGKGISYCWDSQKEKSFKQFIKNLLSTRGGFSDDRLDSFIESKFSDWKRAFTHWTCDEKENYDIYEGLGDRVIRNAMDNYIIRRFPHVMTDINGQWKVSSLVAKLKQKSDLAKFSDILGIPNHIAYVEIDYIVKSQQKRNYLDESMKEDCFEALMGAIVLLLDPFVCQGFGYSIAYNIIASVLDDIDLNIDISSNIDSITKVKELSDRFLRDLKVEYTSPIVQADGKIKIFANVTVPKPLLLFNLRDGNNHTLYKTDTTVSDAQVLSLAEKRAKEIAFPINYKLSSDDIVSKMLKFRNLNQQKSRNDYFVWSWSNRQSYENDEIGIIESKLDLANQILPFFEAAGFVWSIKGTKPLKFTSDKEELSATLHFDGGAVPNPGNAGCGFVVCLDGGKCHKGGKFIGRATNNIAEYTGLLEGLKLAESLGVSSLKVFGDSKLVINQMKGEWAVKQPEIAIIKNKCDEESKKFKTISFTHVLREYNKDADQLADLAISQKKDYSSSH